MKRNIFLALLLILVMGFFSQAMAYKLYGFSLQHRVYEKSTKNTNAFLTEIQTDEGVAVTDPSLFKGMQLFDPKGKEIALSNKRSYLEPGMTATYDINNGKWVYPTSLYKSCMARGDFTTPLVNGGTYHMVVYYAGETLETDYVYNMAIDLPLIASKTITKENTKSKDLIIRWHAPKELFTLTTSNPSLNSSTRAFISVYNAKNEYIGYFQVRVGTHMEEAFFAKSFLDALKGMGGKQYTLSISVRTNDNNSRSYSNETTIKLP